MVCTWPVAARLLVSSSSGWVGIAMRQRVFYNQPATGCCVGRSRHNLRFATSGLGDCIACSSQPARVKIKFKVVQCN